MPIGIMGRKSLVLIDWGSRYLPARKEKTLDTIVCAVSFYVAETSKTSTKDHEQPSPIMPFGIFAYDVVGQPFSKQLYSRLISYFVPQKQIRGDLKAYRAIEMSLNNA